MLHESNVKLLAKQIGVSTSMLYKWGESAESGGSGVPNPLERLAALIEATGDTTPSSGSAKTPADSTWTTPAPPGRTT